MALPHVRPPQPTGPVGLPDALDDLVRAVDHHRCLVLSSGVVQAAQRAHLLVKAYVPCAVGTVRLRSLIMLS